MNITSPILNGAAQAAAMPGDSVASFLARTVRSGF